MAEIKICGLFREQDIEYVNEAMPDYAGFILNFPKSHRNLDIEQAARLRDKLHPDIRAVCVVVDQPMETVLDIAVRVHPDVIQLHGRENEGYITDLKECFRTGSRLHGRENESYIAELMERFRTGAISRQDEETESYIAELMERFRTGAISRQDQEIEDELAGNEAGRRICIWKAFRVRNETDLDAAAICNADEILLDNGYGTGEAFDWSKAESFDRPFILAGGLTPENIPDAVRILHPRGIDISSGVETDRVKDRDKILAAVRAVRTIESMDTSRRR